MKTNTILLACALLLGAGTPAFAADDWNAPQAMLVRADVAAEVESLPWPWLARLRLPAARARDLTRSADPTLPAKTGTWACREFPAIFQGFRQERSDLRN